jgi:hypothetical protein
MAEPQCPLELTLESIKILDPRWQAEIIAIAKRLGFELGSASEPGKWLPGLGGYFWWAKIEERAT